MIRPLYFDYGATTPCDRRVVEAMLPFFSENFGNPASQYHAYGWETEEAVEKAREQVALLIGARPSELIFTSGATESCNLAIRGILEGLGEGKKHVLALTVEHKSVLEPLHRLEEMGVEVTLIPVNALGMPDCGQLESFIRPHTVLVCSMAVNNETGVILPLHEMADIAHKHNIPLFSDATQAVGKHPLDVVKEGIDLMAFTAHKMYGPKGIGALYIRRGKPSLTVTEQISGGSHEKGLRGGTVNVPGIVGFGVAAQLARVEMEADGNRIRSQQEILEKGLLSLTGVYLNGDPVYRIPGITNISIEGVESSRLLLHVSSKLALGTGAACASVTREPSHVLQAMGVGEELLHNSIRISQGRFTTAEEIGQAIDWLTRAIADLRKNP